jgi:3,4-dihydroxy 2-butanone 4-phosphate synthase/GTP cyclohydrolase II
MMVLRNEDSHETAFTVSVDLIADRTTGISAAERANTLRALANPVAAPSEFLRPGHIFPLVAVAGGVHQRAGHTEAGVALCELTNSYPTAVIAELVNDDGSMMRGAALDEFAKKTSIKKISISQIKSAVEKKEITKKVDFTWANLPIAGINWKITTYSSTAATQHAVLALGNLRDENLLVRIHSECLTGDAFGSQRCDCGAQLLQAMAEIKAHGSGLIIYLRDHEGRGIGLGEKIKAYALQDKGENTIQANISLGHGVDERSYLDGIEILKSLNITDIELLTNNPDKLAAFAASGINYKARKLQAGVNEFNKEYLKTKRDLLNHSLGEI